MVSWMIAVIAFFFGGLIGFGVTIIAIAHGRSDPRD